VYLLSSHGWVIKHLAFITLFFGISCLVCRLSEHREHIFELAKQFAVQCSYESVGLCVDHDEYQLNFAQDLLTSSYPVERERERERSRSACGGVNGSFA